MTETIEAMIRQQQTATNPLNNVLPFPKAAPLYKGLAYASGGYRTALRSWLKNMAFMHGAEWEEDKGWFESTFRYRKLPERNYRQLMAWLSEP